ncbi:hypothetical protein JX265_010992 [Neoarthrinium moseri]|uniref:Uncharacterized protein n=1 Tax=Neoarthrinium moseri TaxID=1658444 RepID=A0A9P9WD49_9PEZI|nr:hypothetical protein JX265_010992 [Neoarthrinium moseri]
MAPQQRCHASAPQETNNATIPPWLSTPQILKPYLQPLVLEAVSTLPKDAALSNRALVDILWRMICTREDLVPLNDFPDSVADHTAKARLIFKPKAMEFIEDKFTSLGRHCGARAVGELLAEWTHWDLFHVHMRQILQLAVKQNTVRRLVHRNPLALAWRRWKGLSGTERESRGLALEMEEIGSEKEKKM